MYACYLALSEVESMHTTVHLTQDTHTPPTTAHGEAQGRLDASFPLRLFAFFYLTLLRVLHFKGYSSYPYAGLHVLRPQLPVQLHGRRHGARAVVGMAATHAHTRTRTRAHASANAGTRRMLAHVSGHAQDMAWQDT
jgi:hypothetical protein